MIQIEWICKKFTELTPFEVYDMLRLRSEVFVVEQTCVFLDADNNDQYCYHLLGYNNNKLVAYTRLVPPNTIYKQQSIGRVVTSPSVRGQSAGKQLMQQSIQTIYQLYGHGPIKLGAQLYLKNFYQSFGFKIISDVYLEDYIEHVYMLKED